MKTSDFAPSSSFFGAPVSDTDGSFVAVGCEVLSLGAGRVVNEGEVFFLLTSAPEGVVVAADLRARTSPGHFQTGEELGIARLSARFRQSNAMFLIRLRESRPCLLYLLTNALLTFDTFFKGGLKPCS